MDENDQPDFEILKSIKSHNKMCRRGRSTFSEFDPLYEKCDVSESQRSLDALNIDFSNVDLALLDEIPCKLRKANGNGTNQPLVESTPMKNTSERQWKPLLDITYDAEIAFGGEVFVETAKEQEDQKRETKSEGKDPDKIRTRSLQDLSMSESTVVKIASPHRIASATSPSSSVSQSDIDVYVKPSARSTLRSHCGTDRGSTAGISDRTISLLRPIAHAQSPEESRVESTAAASLRSLRSCVCSSTSPSVVSCQSFTTLNLNLSEMSVENYNCPASPTGTSNFKGEFGGFDDSIENFKGADLAKENAQLRNIIILYEEIMEKVEEHIQFSESEYKKQVVVLESEKSSVLEDLRLLENSFSDLHRRYDKLRTTSANLQENEQKLLVSNNEMRETLKISESRICEFSGRVDLKIKEVIEEADKTKAASEQEVARLQAALRIEQIKVSGLEKNVEDLLAQKNELTKICDELLADHGH